LVKLVITLYSRSGCHLCEQAKKILLELKSDYRFTLEEVDIEKSEELTELYGLSIPVVLVNGQEAAYGKVTKTDVSRYLQKITGLMGGSFFS
jgi:glutaredoxin